MFSVLKLIFVLTVLISFQTVVAAPKRGSPPTPSSPSKRQQPALPSQTDPKIVILNLCQNTKQRVKVAKW